MWAFMAPLFVTSEWGHVGPGNIEIGVPWVLDSAGQRGPDVKFPPGFADAEVTSKSYHADHPLTSSVNRVIISIHHVSIHHI